MGVNMAAAIALDLSKLLGFKRVAVAAGNEATLARALGAACNKIGENGKQQVDTSGIPLGIPPQ
jgi:hypothetical protein